MGKILIIDEDKCTGCRVCEMACSVKHDGVVNPLRSRIRIVKDEWQGSYVPETCRQCESPACLAACPVGAISRDEMTGIVEIDHRLCINCRSCVAACPFGGMSVDPVEGTTIKCDMCGGDPQCVRFCETEAIRYVDVEDAVEV